MSAIRSGQNYSAAQINNWGRKELGEFHKAAEAGGGFTIKGKHFKYNVKVDKDGNSTVTVKCPWYTTKTKDDWAKTKADNLGKALTAKNDGFRKTDNAASTQTVTDTFTDLLKPNKDKDPEVAIYGKGNRTEISKQLKSQGIKVVTIDIYNSSVGIGWAQAKPDKVSGLLTSLRDGNFSTTLKKNDRAVSDTRRTEWAKYLEANVERLDVLAKCKKLGKVKDGGDSLAQFIAKNCAPEKLEAGLQAKMTNAPDRQTRLNLIKGTAAFKELMKCAKDPSHDLDPSVKGLDVIFPTAFFRTTSKMGLEFFSSQQMPVAFWTAELGNETTLTPMDPAPLQLKPWKQLENRTDDTNLQRAESITYSELRYVKKLMTDLQGVQDKDRSGQMAKLTKSSLNIVPVLVRDYAGSKYLELHTDKAPF